MVMLVLALALAGAAAAVIDVVQSPLVPLVGALQCPGILSGVCFPTPGYAFPDVRTPGDCCLACVGDTKCGAWTFIGVNVAVVAKGPCRLKVANNTATPCADGSSGIVRNHTLPPGPPNPGPPHPHPPPPTQPPKPAPPNALSVLFLVVDDLRPEFAAAYGQSHAVTPTSTRSPRRR